MDHGGPFCSSWGVLVVMELLMTLAEHLDLAVAAALAQMGPDWGFVGAPATMNNVGDAACRVSAPPKRVQKDQLEGLGKDLRRFDGLLRTALTGLKDYMEEERGVPLDVTLSWEKTFNLAYAGGAVESIRLVDLGGCTGTTQVTMMLPTYRISLRVLKE